MRLIRNYFAGVGSIINKGAFEVTISYKYCILTIFGFVISIFFNPLLGVAAQDSVFYLNAISAGLCLLFILGELWVPNDRHMLLNYLWFFIQMFSLPFLYFYTMVRSEYYFTWIINFVLASFLLNLIANKEIFLVILGSGVILGFFSGSLLNYYIPSNPRPPYIDFDYKFAIYSSIFLILVTSLIIYNRVYSQKKLLSIVEQEVSDRTKKLKEALDIKKEFLDNVSHEIKTPIHNITNIIAELYDQWDFLQEDVKKELLQNLKASNYRLLNLCTDILDLSKFKKGESGLKIEKKNIEKIIKEAISEYSYSRHSINFLPDLYLRSEVDCDYIKILQVLRNLIDNAIKYGKNSPITIEAVNYGSDSIKISVSDIGIAIPETDLIRIFEPFEQGSRTKTKAGGTGLGLAICKKIIEMHTGSIWATNNENGGATIYFIIPNEHMK